MIETRIVPAPTTVPTFVNDDEAEEVMVGDEPDRKDADAPEATPAEVTVPAPAPLEPDRSRRVGRVALAVVAVLTCALLGAVLVLVVTDRSLGGTKQTTSTTLGAIPLKIRPVEQGRQLSGPTPCPNADGTSPRTTKFSGPPPVCINPSLKYTALLQTTKGRITIALDPERAPTTVNNFVVLARYHFFDGIPFHRIIPGFIVQGGDPDVDGGGGPGYKIPDELPPAGQYKLGSVAMANSGANTNGSQFFIVIGPRGAQLPLKYSLFGEVTEGMDVVKSIESLGSPGGAPADVVAMTSVQIRTG